MFSRITLVLICVVGATSLCACTSTRGKPAIVAVGGHLETTMHASVAEAAGAARSVLTDQKFAIVVYSVTSAGGRLVAYAPTSDRIELAIRPADKGASTVTVITDGSARMERMASELLGKIAAKAS